MSRGPASICAVAGGSSSADDCREGLRGLLPLLACVSLFVKRKLDLPDTAVPGELAGSEVGNLVLWKFERREAFPVAYRPALCKVEGEVIEAMLLSMTWEVIFIRWGDMQEEARLRIGLAARFIDVVQSIIGDVQIEFGARGERG